MENNESQNVDPSASNAASSESSGPSKSERQWAMGCHLVALFGLLIPKLILGLVGTLVLWLIKREDGPFINDQGREALNFQLTILIYAVVSIMLIPLLGLGMFLLVAVAVFDFVCVLVAAVKTSEGIAFRYPACIRFIK